MLHGFVTVKVSVNPETLLIALVSELIDKDKDRDQPCMTFERNCERE